jgi:hypothetical protein
MYPKENDKLPKVCPSCQDGKAQAWNYYSTDEEKNNIGV